jgi:hypothetical protein
MLMRHRIFALMAHHARGGALVTITLHYDVIYLKNDDFVVGVDNLISWH